MRSKELISTSQIYSDATGARRLFIAMTIAMMGMLIEVKPDQAS